ncbi:MAG: hypothetical protein FWF36_06315, partial [Propionibacteriaceae bacterium]|nr:hypothetical protein [Propionibacteriaceae bacterium]
QMILGELSLALGNSAGRSGAVWWDLPTGGRVHLDRLSRSVDMGFICRQYADVERAEARFGISPDRVLGQDE